MLQTDDDRVGGAEQLPRRSAWLDSATSGFAWYYSTSLIVIVSAMFSFEFVKVCGRHPLEQRLSVIDSLAAWDGRWYVEIVREGYSYDPARNSNVAFYPVYPLLGAALRAATGLTPEWALVVVSHGVLCGAFVLLHVYVRDRLPNADASLADYAVLAMGLVPTTLYFRMAYSESTLICSAILAMLAMQRRWPLISIALIVGLATATRAVGVALLLPVTLLSGNVGHPGRAFWPAAACGCRYVAGDWRPGWRTRPSSLATAWRS